jgi:Raf kinase inhibitor-like YbhB/YbcL family protein
VNRSSRTARLLPVCLLLSLLPPAARAQGKAGDAAPATEKGDAKMAMTLSSKSFEPKAMIPARHTCEGKDVSPPLAWTGLPQQTRSLALIVDDPDAPDPKAPRTTWVHWVLYDIPADSSGLPEGVADKDLPQGTRIGINDFKRAAYGGPCPPIGRHRYYFKLYALDTVLPDLKTPTKAALEKAMQGHILGETELMGTYEKGQR